MKKRQYGLSEEEKQRILDAADEIEVSLGTTLFNTNKAKGINFLMFLNSCVTSQSDLHVTN